jgi:hypothetical protein
MATLSDLQAMRDALVKARASGRREVQAGDKRVSYKTDAEMASALAFITQEISRLSGCTSRTILVSTSKGV